MSPNSGVKHRASQLLSLIGLPAWVVLSLFGVAAAIIKTILLLLPASVTYYLAYTTPGLLLLSAVQYVVTLAVAVGTPLLINRWTKRQGAELRKLLGIAQPLQLKHVLIVPLAWAGYFVATTVAASIANQFPGFDINQVQDIGYKNLVSASDLILAFVGLVIVAPIAEELLFRGYLLGKLRGISGFWPSAVVVSLIFGIVHMQWNIGIDTFVLSIFLCWLREQTGSVWAGMLLHGLKNGIAYFILFIGPLVGINLLQ